MFETFHFLRPLVLLLIPVFIILGIFWMRASFKRSEWRQILPMHLHQHLVVSNGQTQSKQAYIWLILAFIIACFALAGPTWEKLPQPVYQTDSGRVLVMDMSLSMRATDVTPSRLARANFKAIDLIKEINDGEVGLVAYAGDAFTISPLTEDIATLENLIPSLRPEIMPSMGSNPELGLLEAIQLLDNAGYQHGHIYWITDGINYKDIAPIRALINESRYEFSVLTIGTQDGAPIQLTDGTLLKDNSGNIVIPKLNTDYINQGVNASNARSTRMTIDDSDIQSMLLNSNRLDQIRQQSSEQSTGDAWRDMGALLLVAALPIVALLFRKGVLFSFAFIAVLSFPVSKPAMAQNLSSDDVSQQPTPSQGGDGLSNLFLNDNQKGQRAFENGEFEQAQNIFNDINWRAASAYKAGDYQTALELFQQGDGLHSIYNQGNALAKLGQLQDAIDAYEKVLQIDSEHERAAANKALLEELLEQQEQQDNENQEQDSQQDQQQSENSDSQQEGDAEQSEQEQSQDQQGEGSQNQQNSDPAPSDNSQEQSDEQNDAQQEQQNEQGDEQSQQQDAQSLEQEQQGQSDENEQQPVQAINQSDLTPQEREELQRLQTLMNKVPDDPAYLLQRKMLMEAQKRRQFAPPRNQEQQW
ncbi:VWA domain-containing protein [Glaciecola sp. XM2]|uniref:VWA domain-containing protein n=1 Tax=Glaciecola sp. XM2 TaxID=1914931 RepID=UPI001BDE03D4|nr:VWA domain-containing protein [Glaciecola sp. XM2]MBT1449913.1 VWA domain-containing protein [Glaciecola sp. XM2]